MVGLPRSDCANRIQIARPRTIRRWRWLPLTLMCTGCPDRPPPPPPPVSSVEIVPAVVYADVGSTFELLGIARAADRTPLVSPGPYSWLSTETALSSNNESKTVVSGFSAGTHRIELTVGGQTASMTLNVAPSPASGDRVRVPHVNGNPVAAVLIDATDNSSGSCYHDLLYRVSTGASLTENLTTRTGCADRLTAFDINRGVLFDLANLWKPALDNVSATLPDPLVVDVVAWYRASVPTGFDPVDAATHDVDYANSIYAARRAGMSFRFVAGQGGADGSIRNYIANVADIDADPCLDATSQLGIPQPVQGTINIVYVEQIIFGVDRDVRGLACAAAGGGPRLVIISRLRMLTSSLAHELAHLMGLSKATLSSDWRGGHTTFLDTFDSTNLMWAQENATVGLPRDNLSLGQVFRMNLDERSWVNVRRTGTTHQTIRTGDTLPCQGSRDTQDPCPKLALDVGKP